MCFDVVSFNKHSDACQLRLGCKNRRSKRAMLCAARCEGEVRRCSPMSHGVAREARRLIPKQQASPALFGFAG